MTHNSITPRYLNTTVCMFVGAVIVVFRFAVTGWIASADDKTFNKDTEAMRVQKGKY